MTLRIFTAGLLAILASCQTIQGDPKGPPTPPTALTPQAGGDCVIHINPNDSAATGTFVVAYNFDGSEAEDSSGSFTHMVEISSDADRVTLGTYDGPDRHRIEKKTVYELVIKDLKDTSQSASAMLYEQDNPGPSWVISVDETASEYKASGFGVLVEKEKHGSTTYAKVVIMLGSEAVTLHVEE